MLCDKDYLLHFLQHVTQHNWVDQPLSMERRGIILYEFCQAHYPDYLNDVTIAWIEAGLSLKKQPAEKVKTKRQTPPESWEIVYGQYKERLRLCFLPSGDKADSGIWYGFETESQQHKPVFKALSSSPEV